MLEQTRKFIEKEMLFHEGARLLVGVSGGVDSMVLLEVLRRLGFQVAAAHVNYNLRNEDSDEDALTVETYCTRYGLRFHLYEVGNQEREKLSASNVQEQARDIRMRFFNGLLRQFNYDVVCTGHHLGDVAETFLLHALRVSGSRGMRSIVPKNGKLCRPLLWSGKEEITDFAKSQKLPFREDQSNFGDRYDRNFLRNQVLPLIEGRFVHAQKRLAGSAAYLADEYELLNYLVRQERSRWCTDQPEGLSINNLSKIKSIPGAASLLHMWLRPYRFSSDTIADLLQASLSGSMYYSAEYEALYDRDNLLIRRRKESENILIKIPSPGSYSIGTDDCLALLPSDKAVFTEDPNVEYVDLDVLVFPLKLRRWQSGDTFQPLGLKGRHKKISDFFNDKKLSLYEKDEVWLLCDKNVIIWIVGHRLAHKARVTDTTKNYLKLHWFASGWASMHS